ncbi:penicillin-binding protein activator [Colwellia sp. MEBiC06753]
MKLEFFKTPVRSLAIIACFTGLLYGCATPKTTQPTQAVKQVIPEPEADMTALDYIAQSKKQSPNEAVLSLVLAAELFIKEQNYDQALWLANKTRALTTTAEASFRISLVLVEALFRLGYQDEALTTLSQVNENSGQFTSGYYYLLAEIQEQRGFKELKIIALLNAFALDSQATELDIDNIWQSFQTLSSWQLSYVAKQEVPYIKGWLNLIKLANEFGYDESLFAQQLSLWQKRFSTHPANSIVNALINDNVKQEELKPQRIAVILPLTGKQQAAGNAAQQGILAAYADNKASELYFFDAETIDWSLMATELEDKAIDFVIGPLLREHVERYLATPELNLPTLLLNIPTNLPLAENQFAISMRPEDEAIQAATTLARQNFKMPIVLVHEDNVSQRIANAFVTEWQRVNDFQPQILPFTQGKQMQTMLKSALGVEQSQARINQLNRRLKQTIKTETRNRRDIDMIYIVGSSTQTRLLKPYIDVSISPFADTIPIFASSRSHSAQVDKSDTRDLVGLSFTEMPWLLKSDQQNSELVSLSDTLFPNRSDSLQRIFAMGYDALALASKVTMMATKPYIRHEGQIGTLMLNQDHILTRSLLWGRYSKESVGQIEMD